MTTKNSPIVTIRLEPEDLEKLDALVRDRQRENRPEIPCRTYIIRDLIREAYQRGHHEHTPASQTRR